MKLRGSGAVAAADGPDHPGDQRLGPIAFGPFGMGDVNDPTSPLTAAQLSDARAKFGVQKSNSATYLRDYHKLVMAPD
eukprot:12476272-Alexandrium_andersonii.AAC.1